jgi:sterol desaturase/sphingolipid hydroxylase (fatty acid hydroxylase superfamily)
MEVLPYLALGIRTVFAVIGAMTLVALLEAIVPLHRRVRRRQRVVANLALTFITFGTNLVFNTAVVVLLAWLGTRGFGVFRWAGLGPVAAGILAVVVLDFAFYVLHVAMHKVPILWRVHRVHHSDPTLDVTTTIRQHPLEGVLRYAVIVVVAGGFGIGVEAFAIYRSLSVLNALLEHANIRVPRWLDRTLSIVTTWPNAHKVHHSRVPEETDSNYGNLFSGFDRIFSTYLPSVRGESVVCGLDGFDDPKLQSTGGLLRMPFNGDPERRSATSSALLSAGRGRDRCRDDRSRPARGAGSL